MDTDNTDGSSFIRENPGNPWLKLFLCVSRLCARRAVLPWAGVREFHPLASSGKLKNPGFWPAGCAYLRLKLTAVRVSRIRKGI